MPTGSSGSPVTLSYTVSYSIGADSANKDQAFVLLSYLAGVEGMTKWTAGGVALPSRKDVPTPAGKDVLTKGSAYARPGSGFMLGYVDVQKAFQDAFTAQIQGKTYDAGPVVEATKAAIDKALGRPVAEAEPPPMTARSGTASGGAPPSLRKARRSEALAGYAMIAVPMVLFLVLQIGTVFYALYISLWRWNVRSGPVDFRGLANYTKAFADPIFHRAIQNSIYYAVVWVPLTMAIGLFLAIIVNQKIRGQTFFRGAYYFPAIASSAAITILWIFIVSPFGLFNSIREVLPLDLLGRCSGTGRTRTGSATRTPRSTR